MGISFKIEKRRNHCPGICFRSWMRRAEGFPGIAMQGETWERLMEPRRPPSLPSPCGVFPELSSFPHFERDPHGPDIHSRVGTEKRASRKVSLPGLPGDTMRRMVPFKEL
jgi:hypothetical protein